MKLFLLFVVGLVVSTFLLAKGDGFGPPSVDPNQIVYCVNKKEKKSIRILKKEGEYLLEVRNPHPLFLDAFPGIVKVHRNNSIRTDVFSLESMVEVATPGGERPTRKDWNWFTVTNVVVHSKTPGKVETRSFVDVGGDFIEKDELISSFATCVESVDKKGVSQNNCAATTKYQCTFNVHPR